MAAAAAAAGGAIFRFRSTTSAMAAPTRYSMFCIRTIIPFAVNIKFTTRKRSRRWPYRRRARLIHVFALSLIIILFKYLSPAFHVPVQIIIND